MIVVMNNLEIEKCVRFLDIVHGALKRFGLGVCFEISRYRFEFKCNELWTEIKYVIDVFGPIFMKLLRVF